MNLEYIITGCPCSGTKYITEALRGYGLKAAHEVFDLRPGNELVATICGDQGELKAEEVEVDVNYGHADSLQHLGISSPIKVIHLVRDPLKVLNSWMATTLRHPELTSANEVAKKLWTLNEAVSTSERFILRHRVEAPIADLVWRMVGPRVPEKEPHEVAKDTNAHNRGRCNFSWEDLVKHFWCAKLRQQYESYGYSHHDDRLPQHSARTS